MRRLSSSGLGASGLGASGLGAGLGASGLGASGLGASSFSALSEPWPGKRVEGTLPAKIEPESGAEETSLFQGVRFRLRVCF